MNNYTLQGTVHKIFDTEYKTATFYIREFVVTIDETSKYPQYVKLQAQNNATEHLDHINEGDTVTVGFKLSGREWNDRYFTNLNAFSITQIKAAQPIQFEDDDVNFYDDVPF